jgi:hypothetical protein
MRRQKILSISECREGASLNLINLAWTPEVLGGGTSVVWTHLGPGSGNFGILLHAFGFRIVAPGADYGEVAVVTDGFSRDTSQPLPDGSFDRDISTTAFGPVLTPVPEPSTVLLVGPAVLYLWRFRHRQRRG